ncbi:MAG: hypothetical protein AAF689_12150 [Pseudomonadota bacterium]
MAVARAGMSLHGTIDLCAGSAVHTVYLDADGTPQTDRHVCAECLIGPMHVPDAQSELDRPARIGWAEPRMADQIPGSGQAFRRLARAPPMPLIRDLSET